MRPSVRRPVRHSSHASAPENCRTQRTNTETSVVTISSWKAQATPLHIPQALESVHAGFPSVAQDYFISDFSFDENIIMHPETTFAVRVAGDSMQGAGIFDGDILLVDRSLSGQDGDVVIAVVEGEMTVKRLITKQRTLYLHPENSSYPDIPITEETGLLIWGVVIGNYHFQHRQEF